ncbi:MAG: hypothetical protein NVV67_00410 [Pseudoxanthomonas sp.]|nr:hypothetical protein [Pseudoxanthomonas sp.]
MLAGSLLAAGCATTATTATPSVPAVPAASPTAVAPEPGFVPVARYGRYTLIELVPEPAQRDLLQQAVEVFEFRPRSMPAWAMPCAMCSCARLPALRGRSRHAYALPLPAAHLRLGPLMLRDALLTLAGPAWELSVDDLSRQVRFQPARCSHLPFRQPARRRPRPCRTPDRPEEMQP